ncbi:MAG TPA: M28 family peptidase, partial [Thermoanaerobaculia bacterium]
MNRILAGLTLGLAIPAALEPQTPAVLAPDIRRTAEALREKAFAGSQAARWVQELTDQVGPRLTGSPGDAAAVAWALASLKARGFANVRAEKAVTHVWKRGMETGEITAPFSQTLVLTALGGSVPTPDGGIEAEVVELSSLAALEAPSTNVRGKIVFFDKKMERTGDGSGYGAAVDVRSHGPARAAKLGAVAVLIRSIGTDHNRTPHTGGTEYEAGIAKIPAAALSVPDAELLERLLKEKKPVRVRLTLTCHDDPDADTANVVGEIPGRERPAEIVLLGAHLDSWDLATGAIDDGAGCGIVIEAARLIGELPRRPRRSVRVVLFANEEHGQAGANGYRQAHDSEIPLHVAALEADSGTDAPTAFSWNAGPTAEPLIREIAAILAPMGAGEAIPRGPGGTDVAPLRQAGVPVFSIRQDSSRYFDYHHTANDTFDKIAPASLDRMVAAVSAFAYVAAEMPEPFEKIPPEAR